RLVLPREPPEERNLQDSGHRFEVVLQIPVLVGTEFAQIVFARLVLEDILEDPAKRRGIRTNFCPDFLRQSCGNAGEILEGSGTRPIDVGSLFEDYVDVGEAEVGDAA